MTETGIDARELTELTEKLKKSPEILSKARTAAIKAAAPKLKALIDGEIGGTGKVRKWQAEYVGSGGGYAAVRPKAKTAAEDSRGKVTRYQVGQVTNAIDSGHAFPTPTGKAGYKPRIRSGRTSVPGRHFYAAAQAKVPAVAQAAAEETAEALLEYLEG